MDTTDLTGSGTAPDAPRATTSNYTSLFQRLSLAWWPIMWGAIGLYAGGKALFGASVSPAHVIIGTLGLLQSAAAARLVMRFVQRRWRWSDFQLWAISVSCFLLGFAATVEPGPKPANSALFWVGGIPVAVGGAALMLRMSQINKR